jgi:hypothetical protein
MPRGFRALGRAGLWSSVAWVVAALAYPTFRVIKGSSPWLHDARLFSAVLLYVSGIVTIGLIAVHIWWRHRVTGEWPWRGYTPRSALREWAGSVGLLEHHGRPAFWAKRSNRAAAFFLLAIFALAAIVAFLTRSATGSR